MINVPMLSVDMLPCPMCAGKVRSLVARPIGHGDVCFVVSCNCGLSFDGGQDMESAVRTWNRRAKPAAQHQGEPITIQAVAVTREDDDEGLRLEWLLEGGIAEMEFAGMMLFAMPEANDLCDEDGSAHVYLKPPAAQQQGDPVFMKPQYSSLPGLKIVCEEGEIGAEAFYRSPVEQPAPVAVVMPERKSEEPTDYRRSSDLFEAELYNSALDDVARLNGVKP